MLMLLFKSKEDMNEKIENGYVQSGVYEYLEELVEEYDQKYIDRSDEDILYLFDAEFDTESGYMYISPECMIDNINKEARLLKKIILATYRRFLLEYHINDNQKKKMKQSIRESNLKSKEEVTNG